MLYNANGTTPQGEGTLVQLIVSSTDNVFTLPSSSSYTGNSSDDFILASFIINSGPGTVAQPLIITYSGNIGAGDQILLRWFPTITGPTPPSLTQAGAPPAGSAYGQFRTDITENFSNATWVLPSDGSTIDLNFLTVSGGGTEPNSAGAANMVVTAIPEPSTYALLGCGLIGALFLNRRNKRVA